MELLSYYSHHPALLSDLDHAAIALDQCQQDKAETSVSVRSAPNRPERTRQKVTDRLSEDDITALIERYHAGEIGKDLAAAFKISHTALKRILRERKARLKDVEGMR